MASPQGFHPISFPATEGTWPFQVLPQPPQGKAFSASLHWEGSCWERVQGLGLGAFWRTKAEQREAATGARREMSAVLLRSCASDLSATLILQTILCFCLPEASPLLATLSRQMEACSRGRSGCVKSLASRAVGPDRQPAIYGIKDQELCLKLVEELPISLKGSSWIVGVLRRSHVGASQNCLQI